MKKSLVIFLMTLLVMLVIVPSNSFAETGDSNHDHEVSHEGESVVSEGEGDFSILYVPCPGGGRHYMTSHGTGTVRNSSGTTLFKGWAHQCSKCLEVVISQNQPRLGYKSLGKYAVKTVGHRLTTAYIMTNPSKTGTNTSLTVSPWTSYTWP